MMRSWMLLLLAVVYSCGSSESHPKSVYEQLRAQKDSLLRYSAESPFRKGNIPFEGLAYFPVEARWKVRAFLRKAEFRPAMVLATSTGEPRSVLQEGRLEFEAEGKKLMLQAYGLEGDEGRLFIPFKDLTTGKETYGAGRYLEAEKESGDSVWLDFNLCYQPYCAYNPAYSCPLVPAENTLSVAVRAGEKGKGGH